MQLILLILLSHFQKVFPQYFPHVLHPCMRSKQRQQLTEQVENQQLLRV